VTVGGVGEGDADADGVDVAGIADFVAAGVVTILLTVGRGADDEHGQVDEHPANAAPTTSAAVATASPGNPCFMGLLSSVRIVSYPARFSETPLISSKFFPFFRANVTPPYYRIPAIYSTKSL
jgi:hypothetical protein